MAEEKDVILVAKAECRACAHFWSGFGWPDLKEEDCLDDPDCPARWMRMAIGVDVDSAAEALASAWLKDDWPEVSRLAAGLSSLDGSVRDQVTRLVKGKVLLKGGRM